VSRCRLWPGSRTSEGYGAGPRGVLAHRLAWMEHVGPIPEGWVVHHVCGVRACVNPAHLQAMPRAEHNRLHDNPRSAREARRAATHCKHGHPFSEANTYWTKDGRRHCRACDARRHRERKARLAA
jgi:uncharacterized UBP type Zn finger protein